MTQPGTGTPGWAPPPRPVRYRPGVRLASTVRALVLASLGVEVVYTLTSWWIATTPRAAGFNYNDPDDPYATSDKIDLVVSVIRFGLLIATAVAVIVWLWRVRSNAVELAEANHRRSRVWVWLGWIVPVVNLWFPYQVVADIHRASDPDLDPWDAVPRRPTPRWLLLWWLPWLVASVADLVASQILGQPHVGTDALARAATAQTVGGVATAVAAVYLLRVVRTVQADQWARAERYRAALPDWIRIG